MSKKVTVYGASWCGPCQRAKQYLNEREIPYEYVDVDENPEAMPKGYKSIPLVDIDGVLYAGFGPHTAKALDAD